MRAHVYLPLLRSSLRPRIHQGLARRLSLGIRKEDPQRTWERRAALVPADVAVLLSQVPDLRVLVERSGRRAFCEQEYEAAGATIVDDLQDADVLVGVKEVEGEVLPGKTYVVFSHCHKGQDYNMPRLQNMLDSGSRFIDWELVADDNGQRLVAFGSFAGQAGMADGLSCLGPRLLALGFDTPFLGLARPYTTSSYDAFLANLRHFGAQIRERGTPQSMPPFCVVITGSGRVAEGAKAVLEATRAVKWVQSSELASLAEGDSDRRWIYACQVSSADYLKRIDGGAYDKADFRADPTAYRSDFAELIAPFATMIVNGAFWQPGQPRLLTKPQLCDIRQKLAQQGQEQQRLLSIVDVSCDLFGGFEFCHRATTIQDPVFYLDAHGVEHSDFQHRNSTQIMTIEILPSELPHAASTYFSNKALPIIKSLLDPSNASSAQQAALERATLLSDKRLRPPHQWLTSKLAKLPKRTYSTTTQSQQKVLLLGSGLVAGSVVETLVADAAVRLHIASDDVKAASRLAQGRCETASLPRDDVSALRNLVGQADLVISLLPAPMHPIIAKECITAKRSLVTASYVSPELRAMHAEAVAANIVLLNELGLDPGIDTLSAQLVLDSIRQRGGKITAYESFCGGVPAPEAATDNLALLYKFSWSPRGALTATFAPAHYRWQGQDVELDAHGRLSSPYDCTSLLPSLALEGTANRNSLAYLKPYELSDQLPTMLRGTLRYKGTARLLLGMQQLGLFDAERSCKSSSWPQLLQTCVGADSLEERDLVRAVERRLPASTRDSDLVDELVQSLQRLGLWPGFDRSDMPPLPTAATLPVDAICSLMAHRLRYLPGERDMVLLTHRVGWQDQSGIDRVNKSLLVAYGDPHDPENPLSHSSMARTVGLPVALAALACVRGQVKVRGVQTAASAGLAPSLIPQLHALRIRMQETSVLGKLGSPGGTVLR